MERKAQELIPLQVFPAQVKEVDENNRTCTVCVNDNVDLYDVKLYAVTDKDLKGFCLLPAKDSQVLVARIANGNDLFVCSFSVVDKVVGTIGKHTSLLVEDEHLLLETEKVTIDVAKDKVTVDADEITFNGGNNDGLIKINALTDKINEFVKAFNEHEHKIPSIETTVTGNTSNAVPGSSSTVSGSGTVSDVEVPKIASPIDLLDAGEYKDTKVKH